MEGPSGRADELMPSASPLHQYRRVSNPTHAPQVGSGEQRLGARFPPSVHNGVVEAGPGENHTFLTQGVFIWD